MLATFLFSSGITLAILASALVALAFGTDFWYSVTVEVGQSPGAKFSPVGPQVGRLYYSRHGGLFRECFYDRINTTWIMLHPSVQVNAVDGYCFLIDLELSSTSPLSQSFSDAYWTMIHLRRAVIASFVCSMALLVIGSVLGAAGCWQSASRYAKTAGLVILLATSFACVAMAFWHGAEFVERNTVQFGTDPKHLQRLWPDDVRRRTSIKYGWSYICAWVGTGLAALSSAVYLIAALWIIRHKEMHSYYPPKMFCLPPSSNTSKPSANGKLNHFNGGGMFPAAFPVFPVEEYFYAKAPVSVQAVHRLLSSTATSYSSNGHVQTKDSPLSRSNGHLSNGNGHIGTAKSNGTSSTTATVLDYVY